ncbi:hypothetical protein GCM10010522_01810 [Kribbella solani]
MKGGAFAELFGETEHQTLHKGGRGRGRWATGCRDTPGGCEQQRPHHVKGANLRVRALLAVKGR